MLRLTIAASVIAAGLFAAPAAEARTTLCESAYPIRMAVIKKHGKRAPGRNICRFGIKTKTGIRRASTHERAKYKRQLKQLHRPAPALLVRTAVPPARAPAGTATASVTGNSTLQAIARCESGGNPSAVSRGGTYRGLLQFDYATWASVGGTGDPAAASPAEQYRRGAILYSQRGSAPWPVCGR